MNHQTERVQTIWMQIERKRISLRTIAKYKILKFLKRRRDLFLVDLKSKSRSYERRDKLNRQMMLVLLRFNKDQSKEEELRLQNIKQNE